MLPGGDYDTVNEPDLTGQIASANVVVTRAASLASQKGVTLTSDELELMERWLAAHFYCVSDQTYASKSTDGASASFHGKTDMNFESTRYGQSALNVDYSGALTNISKRQFARAVWLGKTADEQLTWAERNGVS